MKPQQENGGRNFLPATQLTCDINVITIAALAKNDDLCAILVYFCNLWNNVYAPLGKKLLFCTVHVPMDSSGIH